MQKYFFRSLNMVRCMFSLKPHTKPWDSCICCIETLKKIMKIYFPIKFVAKKNHGTYKVYMEGFLFAVLWCIGILS